MFRSITFYCLNSSFIKFGWSGFCAHCFGFNVNISVPFIKKNLKINSVFARVSINCWEFNKYCIIFTKLYGSSVPNSRPYRCLANTYRYFHLWNNVLIFLKHTDDLVIWSDIFNDRVFFDSMFSVLKCVH